MAMYNSTRGGKYADLSIEKKLLLKIQNENLLPKGGVINLLWGRKFFFSTSSRRKR
jgi:hypothetical protein